MKKVIDFIRRHPKRIISAGILIIFVMLLGAVVYLITLDDGIYKQGDMSNTPYAASTYKEGIKFTEDGIKFTYKNEDTGEEEEKYSSEMAEIIWNEMIKSGSTVENYLNKYEELEKLMNAEIITQYPKITNKEVDLNGTVEFERHKTDGTSIMLQYINLDEFNKYIENNDIKVENYFTMDQNENVLIGVITETTETLNSNNPDVLSSDYAGSLNSEDAQSAENYSKTTYNVSSKPINYKSVVNKYTMPFQYLWSFIVAGDDKYVGLELAELVEKSEIIISIYDNITTSVNTTIYTYDQQKKVDVSATATAKLNGSSFTESNSWTPASEWIDGNYRIEHVTTNKTNTPIVDVRKADVWIIDYEKEYKYQQAAPSSNQEETRDLDNKEYEESQDNPRDSIDGTDLPYYDKFADKLEELKKEAERKAKNSGISNTMNSSESTEVSTNVTQCTANYYTHDINRKETNKYTESSQKYIAETPISNPKVKKKTQEEINNGTGQDNFVTILCDASHRRARDKICTEITSWLFEMLENNPDTVNMVELTKYLLNQILGREQFDTDFTFDEFENNNFYSTSTIYGNNFEEKVWFSLIGKGYSEEATAGAMGNFMQESGFRANNLQDSYEKKLGMTDESYTDGVNSGSYSNFVHDSAGYGLAQWTFWSRKEALLSFAKEFGDGRIDNEDMQINFLFKELEERGCTGWENATSVYDACYNFEKEFEQAGTPQMGNRLKYAEDIYSKYHGKTAPTGGDINLSGDNKEKMQALLQEAQRIANDNRYTYSQSNRDGEFQYDCSSLVYRLYLRFFGIQVPNYTGAYGDQYRVGGATSVELQPGDVLWRSGHVTLYIGNGVYVAAHGQSFPINDQISVYNDNPGKYTYVYRFITN